MMNSVGGAVDPLATEVTKLSTSVIQALSAIAGEGSVVRDVMGGVAKNIDLVAYALAGLTGIKVLGFLSKLALAFKAVMLSANGVGLAVGAIAGVLLNAPERAEKNARNPENLAYDGLHDEEPEVVIEPYQKAKTEAVQSAKVGLEPKSNDIGSKRQIETAQQPRVAQSGGDKTLVIKLQMDSQVIDERIVRINEQSAQEVTESYKSRTVR